MTKLNKDVEKWVDIIREWHKDDPYPPIRPLAKKVAEELARERKEFFKLYNSLASMFEEATGKKVIRLKNK